jgi:hypothetical protein
MMTGALVKRRSPGRRVTHESMCWVGAAQESLLVQDAGVTLGHGQPVLLAVAPHLLGALDAGDTALGTCSPAHGVELVEPQPLALLEPFVFAPVDALALLEPFVFAPVDRASGLLCQ